ncbi:MAG: hypothetical protein ACI35W_02500 [Anaeroplasmataceae bacterium]
MDISYDDFDKKTTEERLTEAIIGALLAQFSVDIFFSIFFTDNNIIIDDIRETDIALYYGALASGIVVGLSNKYLDRIGTIFLATTFFAIANNTVNYFLNEEEYDIDSEDLIFDIIASVILVYLFDPKAKYDYINHYNYRHHIPYRLPNTERSLLDIIIIIVVLNTYSGIKDTLTGYTPATTSGATNVD